MIPALLGLLLGFTPSRSHDPEFLRVCATEDTSSTNSAADTTATGLSWTPAPSSVYRITAAIVHTAGATTTGLQFRVDPGNATTGSCYGVARSTSSTTNAVYTGSVGTAITTNDVLGASSANTFTLGQFTCVLESTSSPTAVSLKFHPEADGSNPDPDTVTIKAGLSCLHIERLR